MDGYASSVLLICCSNSFTSYTHIPSSWLAIVSTSTQIRPKRMGLFTSELCRWVFRSLFSTRSSMSRPSQLNMCWCSAIIQYHVSWFVSGGNCCIYILHDPQGPEPCPTEDGSSETASEVVQTLGRFQLSHELLPQLPRLSCECVVSKPAVITQSPCKGLWKIPCFHNMSSSASRGASTWVGVRVD